MSLIRRHNKEIDVAIFGATGFTGRLVAEAFGAREASAVWAMAGRNPDKLRAVADEIGADGAPIIVADADEPSSLKALCERSKVVLTTVGPYQLYGDALLAACAETGTDYVDLCGEPAWMRAKIDQHEKRARDSGARIVFSCGFDSIPFDISVYLLQEEAKERFGAPCAEIKGRVRNMKGRFSGGTAASLKATMAAAMKDQGVIELLKNPFALTPGFQGPKQPSASRPAFDEKLGVWCAPFIMAPINTKNIHRSNMLLGHAYGEDFLYSEMVMTGPGDDGEAAAKAIASDDSLTREDAPKPGEGPSREERENGSYDVLFIGETASGERLTASVAGDMDPGYGSTSKMIAEAALCLTEERAEGPGGIFTPAPAFGRAIVDRLQKHAGLSFRVGED